MCKIFLTWVILLVLCFNNLQCIAQEGLLNRLMIVNYSINEGLPSAIIYKIVRDDYGYLWMASDKGLIKYDGSEFTLVPTYPNEDFVDAIKDKNNLLWLFSFRGRSVGMNLTTHRLVNTDSIYKLKNSNPWLFAQANNDSLWLLAGKGVLNQQIVLLDQNRSLPLQGYDRFEKMLSDYIPGSLDVDSFLNVFSQTPFCFSIRDNGLLLMRTNIFLPRKGQNPVFYFEGKAWGLNNNITDFLREGNDLWVSLTDAALLLRYNNYFDRTKPQQTDTLLKSVPVTRLLYDNGHVWAGSYGYGLFRFRTRSHEQLLYYKLDDPVVKSWFPKEGLLAIAYLSRKMQIYTCGPDGQLSHRPVFETKFQNNAKIRDVIFFRQRWIVITDKGVFSAPSQSNGLPGKFNRGLYGLDNVSGYRHAIEKATSLTLVSNTMSYESTDDSFKTKPHSATQSVVCGIEFEDDLLIGNTYGLFYKGKQLPYLNKAQVNRVTKGKEWHFFCTSSGLYCIKTRNLLSGKGLRLLSAKPVYDLSVENDEMYAQFDHDIGIYHVGNEVEFKKVFSIKHISELGFIKSFSLSQHCLSIVGKSGVIIVPRSGILQSTARPPIIQILASLDNNLPGKSYGKVRSNQDAGISFKVEVIDYESKQYSIAFDVQKNHLPWSYLDFKQGNKRLVMPMLEPGEYDIVAKVRNDNTGELFQKRYQLVVVPSWWQTKAWYIFCACLIVLLVGLLLKLVVKKMNQKSKRELEERRYNFELEAKNSAAQLNPHFIFNALTPLQHFILKGDKLGSLNYLDRYVTLMRNRIKSLRERYISLQQELSFLEDYILLQNQNTPVAFSHEVIVEIDERLEDIYLPSLLLQPLVENAIEHGIKSSQSGKLKKIEVWVKQKANMLEISVIDNGVGLGENFKLSENHALHIISERVHFLKQQFGTGSLVLMNNEQAGAKATLFLPLLSKKDTY